MSESCQIIWVDLRYSRAKPSNFVELSNTYRIKVIASTAAIDKAIELHNPSLICFDFDLPDQMQLEALRQTKTQHPALPFLMLTDDHSTELAIWALKSRAWDYFIKPVFLNEVIVSIDILLNKLASNGNEKRSNFMLLPDIPAEARPVKNKINGMTTVYAIDYVQQHLANKIVIEIVAKRCGMSKSHFSRTFKKEHNITFQSFLIQQRMEKAVMLLKNSDLHVTQIALAVGYSELSNFTTMFQRVVGTQPTSFRKTQKLSNSGK